MGINKELLQQTLTASGFDILHNSPERPIIQHFPTLTPLTNWDNGGPVRIGVGEFRYTVRSAQYKAGFTKLNHDYRSLGVWTGEDDPVGFCEYEINNGVPWGYMNGIQIGQKGRNNSNFGIVEGRPDEFSSLWPQLQIPGGGGPGSTAYYLKPDYRRNGLGQTMHAIMLSLLQASGYSQFMTVQDITSYPEWRMDHNHSSVRLRENGDTMTTDLSLYGRYTELLDQRSVESARYSTALSTYQVFLLCQATRSSLSL